VPRIGETYAYRLALSFPMDIGPETSVDETRVESAGRSRGGCVIGLNVVRTTIG